MTRPASLASLSPCLPLLPPCLPLFPFLSLSPYSPPSPSPSLILPLPLPRKGADGNDWRLGRNGAETRRFDAAEPKRRKAARSRAHQAWAIVDSLVDNGSAMAAWAITVRAIGLLCEHSVGRSAPAVRVTSAHGGRDLPETAAKNAATVAATDRRGRGSARGDGPPARHRAPWRRGAGSVGWQNLGRNLACKSSCFGDGPPTRHRAPWLGYSHGSERLRGRRL